MIELGAMFLAGVAAGIVGTLHFLRKWLLGRLAEQDEREASLIEAEDEIRKAREALAPYSKPSNR